MVTQLDFAEVSQGLRRAGYWFPVVLALWAFLYLFNTGAWLAIIRSVASGGAKISFMWLYKVTVSGFALNYATPGGLMGGEPYRIMELAPHIGTERATSSVILYAMTHIFSHFWFWLLSSIVFFLTVKADPATTIVVAAAALFSLLGLWFFIIGYRKGLAMRAMRWSERLPWVRRHASAFIQRHKESIDTIDSQIASLHSQNRRTLVVAVCLELLCRICSAAEIYLILIILSPTIGYLSCVLILAFTSLFANILFFLPLQLGGREGGFLLSASGLGLSSTAGIFVALLVRLRELVWTAIGLALIKIGASNKGEQPLDNDTNH